MPFYMPKPVHGWRQFFGEVGIIVVGILLALGAEQLVETANSREQVETFRQAVHRELEGNLGTYQYRMGENACVKRRLDDLEDWLTGWRAGDPRTLVHAIGTPRSLSLETSVWESRDANLISHMPIDERLAISRLYDEFGNNEVHRLDERETWLALGEFDGASALDNRDLMRLRGLISRARFRDQRMTENAILYLRDGATLGLKPRKDSDYKRYEPAFCASLFAPGSQSAGLRI